MNESIINQSAIKKYREIASSSVKKISIQIEYEIMKGRPHDEQVKQIKLNFSIRFHARS